MEIVCQYRWIIQFSPHRMNYILIRWLQRRKKKLAISITLVLLWKPDWKRKKKKTKKKVWMENSSDHNENVFPRAELVDWNTSTHSSPNLFRKANFPNYFFYLFLIFLNLRLLSSIFTWTRVLGRNSRISLKFEGRKRKKKSKKWITANSYV